MTDIKKLRELYELYKNAENGIGSLPAREAAYEAFDKTITKCLPDLLNELEQARKVIDAVRAHDECIEQGFMSKTRPDITRAAVNRAVRAYDTLVKS